MQFKVKPCGTVGGAFMVVKSGKFGKQKPVAIGLTELEAKSWKRLLTSNRSYRERFAQ